VVPVLYAVLFRVKNPPRLISDRAELAAAV
jgi:hypothetical protein